MDQKSSYKGIYCNLFPLWLFKSDGKMVGTTYMLPFMSAWDLSCECKCIFWLSNCIFHWCVKFSTLSFLYTTQLYDSFFPISNLLIHTYFFFFFSRDPPFWTFFSSTASAFYPRPPFLSVPCQQGKARSDCQATSEPRGGSAGIKAGMMWPIISMPQCSEDTVWPSQNQSYVGPSLDMSFAEALSIQVVCQKFLW